MESCSCCQLVRNDLGSADEEHLGLLCSCGVNKASAGSPGQSNMENLDNHACKSTKKTGWLPLWYGGNISIKAETRFENFRWDGMWDEVLEKKPMLVILNTTFQKHMGAF